MKQIIQMEHNSAKNHNWYETNQLIISQVWRKNRIRGLQITSPGL